MPDPATASREAAIAALRSQGFRCEQPHRESLHDTAPDSLRLASLAVALGERTGRHVPLRLLFDSRSVGDLLDALESAGAHDAQPASHRQPLDPAGRRDRSLLTFSQERMVFMQGLAEHSAAYSVVFGLLLAGDLDVPRLEQALAVLVERRPALRARFLPSGEGTAMVPFDGFRFRLDRIEPAVPATRAEAIDCAGAYAREPFDLEAGPPFRAALIGAGAGERLLVLVFHHVVIDQFAFEALLAELVALYDDPTPRPVAGERRKLGSTRDSYAQWQRNWFRQHAFGKQRAYWMNRMAGAERVTLPPDHARPAFPDFGGRRWPLRLDEATWVTLERLAADRQASLAMLLQAALWLLLRNHTGKDDITTGLAIANRNHRGAANVALSLVNTIPLRIDGGGATRFAEVLARARSAFLEGFEHQDLPFDLLVKQLDLDRRAGLSPLFGVMLNVLNVPTTARAFGDIGIERVEIDRGGSQFDLTLTVDRQFTRTIWFEYAVALYEPATVQRFAGRLEALLAALVAGGLEQDCKHLPHHAPAEAALLRTWSGNSLPVPAAPDPWRLFTEAAGRNAGRIAATDATTRWRYADLERAAASIAAGLQSAGLASGDRIGVLVDRGVALPAVLWGALAARITFVPLDATLPADRLRHIAADSGMNAVIVQAGAGDLPWLPVSVRRLALDDLLACDPVPIATAAPDGIAYVLYTSGTTGRPKGVAIPQASLGQFLQAMQRWPGLAPEERVLAVTTLTFDISLLELLLPTSTGASVHVASRDEVRDGALLATLIREQGISLLQGTPATWYQLKASGWGGDPQLRAFVGGEAFPPGLAAWLLPRVGEVWNLYGPTEATVWITCHRLTDAAAMVVPVGRPIDGAKVHVVDGCGREVPVGVEGEIVLGGAGLAEGYVNLPELTAARFRAFPAIDGCDRAYVTGDRGRWHPDGLLEVLGRLDSQLKLRGYRIEATEIETLALEVPGVSKAMASVRSGGEGDDRLVLHVESDADDELPPRVLERLRRGLPDYMLPQQIVPVRSFPLQPNGKVDRIALGQLGPRQSGAETHSAPARPEPQDATEAALLGLWRELLAESSIHVDDDFFRCGGHSLLAMRLVGRIRQDLRLPCTLAEVFRHPTPRSLTAVLRSARPLDAETIVPLRMTGEAPPFFCICGVQLYRRLADALEDSVQVFGAFIPLDPDAAESDGPGVVQDLATRYVEMIRRYQPRGPYRLLGFSLGGVVAYEMAQQLAAARESVESLVLLDSDAPGPERKQWARTAWAKVRRRNVAGSTPDAVTPHIRAIRRYQAQPYAGPVLYVEASRAERADAVTDWNQLVPRHHRVVVDCDHLELMQEPQASQVARAIRAHLRLD